MSCLLVGNLMSVDASLPAWLSDVFLGYGLPSSIVPNSEDVSLDLHYTCMDLEHIQHCFPNVGPSVASPPYHQFTVVRCSLLLLSSMILMVVLPS